MDSKSCGCTSLARRKCKSWQQCLRQSFRSSHGLLLSFYSAASNHLPTALVLKNPTVVRDTKALDVFPVCPVGVLEAIHRVLGEDKGTTP